MLSLDDVTFGFKRTKILKGLKLNVNEQELFGLIAPEQKGKSLVCRIIAGLLMPDRGKVYLNGIDIYDNHTQTKQIGYLPQTYGGDENLQVNEYLKFFCELHHIKDEIANAKVAQLLETVGMKEYEMKYVSKLTKGLRNKLGIARALIGDPKLLVLDETITGLDPDSRVEIQTLLYKLKQNGMTIFITSSNLDNLMKICDRIALLENGVIVASGTEEEIQELKRNANAILIRVHSDVNEAMSFLRNHEKVDSIARKENLISIRFSGDDGEEASLLSEMIQNNIAVSSFYREESDFDTLYMKLMKK